MQKLRILARAELALAQIKMQRTGFQVALFAVAALFLFSSLILLNFAGYNSLVPRFGAAVAALLVAVVNMALAGVAIIVALKTRPGSANEQAAREIRDMASEQIKQDVDEIREDIQRVSDEIAGVRAGLASVSEAVPSGVRSVIGLARKVGKGLDDLG
jgi:hypothetical protein